MSVLTIKQHSTEQPRDFLVRINNQAALCELTKLTADPVQETTKLVFLSGLADPHLKLKVLDHIQAKGSTSVTDLVSLASITGLQRTFALREEKSPQPIFNASDSCHQQLREMKTHFINSQLYSIASGPSAIAITYVLLVGIVGATITATYALRCTEPATNAEKCVTSKLSIDRQELC